MPEKLKDILFPREKVEYFSQILKEEYTAFKAENFVNCVCDDLWPERELKEKMRHTTLCLHRFLPEDFSEAVIILQALVPKVKGFEAIVLPDYIEVFGLDFPEISLPAFGVVTSCGSSEFGIRPFLIKDLKGTMKYMNWWADSDDFKVRRFASEGCRPRLPWGMGVPALKKDPSLILPNLEKLKDDPEEFVRKSVANNLNDISKDHPELVLDICESWQGKSPRTDWIIKQACRTLLKQGNKRAMLLFGFANPELMMIENLQFSNRLPKIGDQITFSFDLRLDTRKKQQVRLEYIVHFIKSSGKPFPKVFQLKETELKPGTHFIQKKHSFANMSTRKHFTGEHKFEMVINGDVKASEIINLG